MNHRNQTCITGKGHTIKTLRQLIFLQFLLLVVASSIQAADGDEKVIFLHHSTGGNVYSQGGVSAWIENYNNSNATAYTITARPYPNTPYPWNNYPYDYWNLWIDGGCNSGSSGIECMDTLARDYDVIIYKHCYPGADVDLDPANVDISSSRKTLQNYKLQYRALRTMMDTYPDTRFIVWTLAPRHRLYSSISENGERPENAKAFVDWVKNQWLTEDGKPHDNIFIFDFWGYAAESDSSPALGRVNTLRYEYEISHTSSDSHPNRHANETIGPHFSQFIVDTIEQTGANPAPDSPAFLRVKVQE